MGLSGNGRAHSHIAPCTRSHGVTDSSSERTRGWPGDHGRADGPESDPRMLWPIVVVALVAVLFGLTAGLPGSPAHWALSAVLPSFGSVMP